MLELSKAIIIDALKEKNVTYPCNRCGSTYFEVVGETDIELKSGFRNIILPLNCAIIACSHCGFITLHASSALHNQECCIEMLAKKKDERKNNNSCK